MVARGSDGTDKMKERSLLLSSIFDLIPPDPNAYPLMCSSWDAYRLWPSTMFTPSSASLCIYLPLHHLRTIELVVLGLRLSQAFGIWVQSEDHQRTKAIPTDQRRMPMATLVMPSWKGYYNLDPAERRNSIRDCSEYTISVDEYLCNSLYVKVLRRYIGNIMWRFKGIGIASNTFNIQQFWDWRRCVILICDVSKRLLWS
jgi:hypothetical protein